MRAKADAAGFRRARGSSSAAVFEQTFTLWQPVQAVDVLTPLGRGQAQLVTGPRGAGKSRCGMDAVLGQVHPDGLASRKLLSLLRSCFWFVVNMPA
jgi:hypothetical protein